MFLRVGLKRHLSRIRSRCFALIRLKFHRRKFFNEESEGKTVTGYNMIRDFLPGLDREGTFLRIAFFRNTIVTIIVFLEAFFENKLFIRVHCLKKQVIHNEIFFKTF